MTMLNDPHAAFIESARRLRNRVDARRPVEDFARDEERSQRSRQTGHRFKVERPRKVWCVTNGYVPELSARIDDDPNLCDGARRCARKIAELTYRGHRNERALPVTVTFLARALGRCRRSVQRYLRQLEEAGYIAVDVVAGQRSRLCIGLIVRLLEPLFARHHAQTWPASVRNPGATAESRNQRLRVKRIAEGDRIPVMAWAVRSTNGVFASLMKTNPLAGLAPIAST